MILIVETNGEVRGIYGEEIALDALGQPRITRASHVEPDDQGRWLADLSPIGGPILGPFDKRSEALDEEVAWLEEYWLEAQSDGPNFESPGSEPGSSQVGSTVEAPSSRPSDHGAMPHGQDITSAEDMNCRAGVQRKSSNPACTSRPDREAIAGLR